MLSELRLGPQLKCEHEEGNCRKFLSANKSSLRRVVMHYNSVRKFPTLRQQQAWKPTDHGSHLPTCMHIPHSSLQAHVHYWWINPLSTDNSTLFATQSIFIFTLSSERYTLQKCIFQILGRLHVGIATEPTWTVLVVCKCFTSYTHTHAHMCAVIGSHLYLHIRKVVPTRKIIESKHLGQKRWEFPHPMRCSNCDTT